MNRTSPNSRISFRDKPSQTSLGLVIALLLCTGLSAQQPNSANASMTINGDDGPTYPITNLPVNVGDLALFAFTGVPNAPVLLAVANVLHPESVPTTFGFLDLEFSGTKLFVNGEYSTDGSGVLILPVQVPAALPTGYTVAYQGGLLSPALPAGAQLTAATSIVAVAAAPTSPATDNTMIISTPGWSPGTTLALYPVQTGRAFVQGEITDYPAAYLDGAPLQTQSDVKNRWPDGSVKFAIVSFMAPGLEQGHSYTVSFRNQQMGNNAGAPDEADMLSSHYDFEAFFQYNFQGNIATVTARDMIAAGKFEYWTRGPIATTVILADHSTARTFDVGADAHRSVRPMFHVTFWPMLNKVHVRYISEIACTETLQNQTYDVAIGKSNSAPATFYSKSGFEQTANSRWTKSAWHGWSPPEIAIDHNLSYLIKTRFLPQMNTTPLPQNYLVGAINTWNSRGKDIGQEGSLRRAQGQAGGHPQIGPFPQWDIEYLRSGGNPTLARQVFENGDLSGRWPLHFREGNPTKTFDYAGQISALGRVVSTRSRPSVMLAALDYGYTHVPDRIIPVGPRTDGSWTMSRAHYPNLNVIPYLLTGDFYYLEQMYFFASYAQAHTNGAATTASYGRGPTGKEGVIFGSPRNMAWGGQQRLYTAFLAPDGSPEKQYFDELFVEALAAWEGERLTGIPTSSFAQDPILSSLLTWGHNYNKSYPVFGAPGPFNHAEEGNSSLVSATNGMNGAIVSHASSTWAQHFWMYLLGRAVEFGYPAERLAAYQAQYYVIHLEHPSLVPTKITHYCEPSIRASDGQFFTSVAEMLTGYLPQSPSHPTGLNDNWNYVSFTQPAVAAAHFIASSGILDNYGIPTPVAAEITNNFQSLDLWARWSALLAGDSRSASSTSLLPNFDICPALPH